MAIGSFATLDSTCTQALLDVCVFHAPPHTSTLHRIKQHHVCIPFVVGQMTHTSHTWCAQVVLHLTAHWQPCASLGGSCTTVIMPFKKGTAPMAKMGAQPSHTCVAHTYIIPFHPDHLKSLFNTQFVYPMHLDILLPGL